MMHPTVQFHEYIQYGLGVMAQCTYGGTDRGKTKYPSAMLPVGEGIKEGKTEKLFASCGSRTGSPHRGARVAMPRGDPATW